VSPKRETARKKTLAAGGSFEAAAARRSVRFKSPPDLMRPPVFLAFTVLQAGIRSHKTNEGKER